MVIVMRKDATDSERQAVLDAIRRHSGVAEPVEADGRQFYAVYSGHGFPYHSIGHMPGVEASGFGYVFLGIGNEKILKEKIEEYGRRERDSAGLLI